MSEPLANARAVLRRESLNVRVARARLILAAREVERQLKRRGSLIDPIHAQAAIRRQAD